ncbi:MAG: helicase-related protein [Planctomycetota bacterium]|jgi:very-short-patch-repair endonuclease
MSGGKLKMDDTTTIIENLFEMLRKYGLIEICRQPKRPEDTPGYRLASAVMIWKPGTGEAAPIDRLRITQASSSPAESNPYFVSFFKNFADSGGVIEAREHTAQVSSDERQIRERRFRQAELPVLFCSPTMELGVDISQLNLVNMRNVPPTPANYAQRSGRAGRSGQPALVYTYCSGFSPHDQYYFRQPEKMVAGIVAAPRIELLNEHLIRSHVHAIWLAESGLDLGQTLCDVLDVSEEDLSLPLKGRVQQALADTNARHKARDRARRLIASIGLYEESAPWYREGWLEDILSQLPQSFHKACDRWRSLYRSAVYQRNHQHRIIGDHGRSPQDRERAKRLRAEAEAQIKILTTAAGVYEGDFYSYRYFASEGFLPGYNFPRLPLSAFIPGRRGRKGKDEYLSRPRFLAVSEFGPRAIIYHEGIRYTVNKVSLDHDLSQGDLATSVMKRCTECGYGHFSEQGAQNDVCDLCGAPLEPDSYRQDLVRMQNVSAKRARRITCDEEERQRRGYRIETSFRFATSPDGTAYRRDARIEAGETKLGRLSYGDAARIWRVNLGWSRAADDQQDGFLLDLDRGYWATRRDDAEDAEDPMSDRKKRIIPYVEDDKNVLVFTPEASLDDEEMASLQAAIKEATQKYFQLEPRELAVLPLPDRNNRKSILLYESSEGGAGVLRQLVDDRATLAAVAREALILCHFDPDTGEDTSSETCGAACYDCLLDYANQPDHELLTRHRIRSLLQRLAGTTVYGSSVVGNREDHLTQMMAMCDSQLERKWLKTLEDHGLRLPTHAQFLIEDCSTRPDFYYEDHRAAIYIDGPPHDELDAKQNDEAITDALMEAGYLVIRFHHRDDWQSLFAKYSDVFGGNQ